MKKIINTKWQITLLLVIFLLFLLSFFIKLHINLSLIFAGVLLIVFGIIYNVNVNSEIAKYYNKSDVMKTSPLTVLSVSIGFFLLFKSVAPYLQ